MAAPANPAPAPARTRSMAGPIAAAVLVAIVVIVAGLYALHLGPFATGGSSAAPAEAGGFTQGSVVTFEYSGAFECVPSLAQLVPSASADNTTTPCEVGQADTNAVPGQLPQWLLVPAFAGFSIFGASSLGASSRGFPMYNGSTIATDCGAGASATACPDLPNDLYGATFAEMESARSGSNGSGAIEGLPEGVVPVPAHDQLLNTSDTVPIIPWGTILVFVFDPDIFPSRTTGGCTAIIASNLSVPTANCLTSIAALDRAMSTSSGAVGRANGGASSNPVWTSVGSPTDQVWLPGDATPSSVNDLDSDLYQSYSVHAGAPATFPN